MAAFPHPVFGATSETGALASRVFYGEGTAKFQKTSGNLKKSSFKAGASAMPKHCEDRSSAILYLCSCNAADEVSEARLLMPLCDRTLSARNLSIPLRFAQDDESRSS
jgi:hypothetical protein